MQPERWRQIEEIFQSAADCAPQSRSALLESACGDDTELRREIESLLVLHENSDPTSASSVADAIAVLEQRNRKLNAGSRIGAYRVLREIGRGGMGTVYLAARADDAFQKQVAIKVIRRGLDTDDISQRFRSERQILAMLDHPNIARLLDGGTTDDGLPYFVMEYIEGEPIDLYCDQGELTVTERLKLFQDVAAAVQYAHQNLVVHRDIKPGNVLVTKEGVPRLLDFGIAKVLAPGMASGEQTLGRLRPFTPEYASPEQVRGETITTASDVYSLGVLLYKLLTGRRPYRQASPSPAEIERSILDEESERPSVAVMKQAVDAKGSETPVTPDSASRARGGTRAKLRSRLQGDLDNIVLMALRKEPQRRYASAEQFSEDIGRHLGDLPVVARLDTRGYRTAKLIQRNKAWVTAAVVVFLSLTGGIATTLWQTHVARQQRDRARVEQAKADRINAFLQDMLTYTSPEYSSLNASKNKDARVSEVVDQAAKRAETELADQPEVLAAVEGTIGGVYAAQGRLDQAEPLVRAAREKSIRLYGLNSHEVSEVSNELGNVVLSQGKYAEADSLFRQDIEIERTLEKAGKGNAVKMAYALGGYGAILDQRGDSAAEGYLKEALKYASNAFSGRDRVAVAIMYNNLSNTVGRRGDRDQAERYLRAALEEYRKLPEGTYVEMGPALANLGALLINKGNFAEAEIYIRQSLDLRLKVLGNAHTVTALGYFRLADLYYHEGRYNVAEKAARESIAIFHRALARPRDNALLANPLTELGMILDKTGNHRPAEAALREALEIRTRLLPKGNQLIAITQARLGESLTLQKRYAQAEPFLLDSYQTLQSTTAAGDMRRNDSAQRLVTLYQAWGRPQEAARYASFLARE